MTCRVVFFYCVLVALRKESVDRNEQNYNRYEKYQVALRKESVDRNADVVAE